MSTQQQQPARQPNLQNPTDAAQWLQQMWPQTRPPENAPQAFTLMFATALQTLIATVLAPPAPPATAETTTTKLPPITGSKRR